MKKGLTVIELIVILAIGLVFLSLVFAGASRAHAAECGGWFQTDCGSATNQQQDEQDKVTSQINKLTVASPVPSLETSLERDNISKRLQLFSNPAKISYIYLTSYGKVMAFYTVKGKVTSGSKRLTSTERQVDSSNCATGNCSMVMESPELDGTYGSSASYIFFWTTDGTYVQWNGEYMLADQPLQLTTTPELVRQVK